MEWQWYPVKVHIVGEFFEEIFEDEIKGLSEEDAIRRAKWNWEVDNIELIKKEVN